MDQNPSPPGAVLLCVRVPKCGSVSLMRGLSEAFAGQRIFYLPNTLDPDSRVSPLQKLRFYRARFQNLSRHGGFRMSTAWNRINRDARPGDLVMGGHIDFRTASTNIVQPLKIITLLREPVARARSEYDYMRRGFLLKPWLSRFDASVLHKAAGRHDFDSYLDYLFERRHIYGDIACQYLGWDGVEGPAQFFARNVFHCGVLEHSGAFARDLADKLGRAFSLPHENRVGTERTTVTPAQQAILERIYPRDLLLYAWVSGRA